MPERILIVGGEHDARERFLAELRGEGHQAEERAGVIEDAEGAALVLVAGGGAHARRDGFGATADAVIAARQAAQAAAVIACVPKEAGADAIAAALQSGADDVLICPPCAGTLLARVRAGLRLCAARRAFVQYEHYGGVLSELTATSLRCDAPERLHELLGRVCGTVGWARAALLLCSSDGASLTLVATSDDPDAGRLPLDVERYPEVAACLSSGQPVLVEDTRSSSLLGAWAPAAAEHGGPALLALPLCVEDRTLGTLLLRAEASQPQLPGRALEFLRLVAAMLAMKLQDGQVFDSLREQTRPRALLVPPEERRARALEQYRDFFESASDGMLVLDETGGVLYVNRAAEQMTGFARSGLTGRPIVELVAEAQRGALLEVIRDVADGASLETFDLQLTTTSGEALTVSVSSSSVLSEHGAAILAFRDVTEARSLETELRRTKDFLERLIDSAVDGIIAADLSGRVMIFNQGASRLYGYTPDEVLAKIPVWMLYPEGVAREIMQQLRSSEHGGVGRLAPVRRDILTKSGELVPVTMAASVVYQKGREVASVGILSDLRERIKIEERLQQAQEKLLQSEKQALIAELAGTTAHELNQPLTSVMGYSELLRKRMSPDDAHFRAVDIILREAERMAEIVRKIGRITRYETKAYVGSTTILDLDKSTNDG